MTPSLSLSAIAALFSAMAVLAAVPSLSVLTVASHAASGGLRHGAMAALGVVVGDLVWIAAALFGLALLVEAAGDWAWMITVAGAGYLIALGVQTWRASRQRGMPDPAPRALGSSFMAGLLLTLADQKAVLFYLGFLPAFVDLSRVTVVDAALIGLTALFAVGGVKLVYVVLASRIGQRFDDRLGGRLNQLAAAVMIGTGLMLIFRLLATASAGPT